MEKEVFVGDVIPKIANDPGFDGVSCRAPFVGGGGKHIEAAWMREAEFLLLDFFRSCVSGRSGVCVEWEEGGRAVSASVGGRGALGAVSSAMVCVMLLAWLLLVKFMKIFLCSRVCVDGRCSWCGVLLF